MGADILFLCPCCNCDEFIHNLDGTYTCEITGETFTDLVEENLEYAGT